MPSLALVLSAILLSTLPGCGSESGRLTTPEELDKILKEDEAQFFKEMKTQIDEDVGESINIGPSKSAQPSTVPTEFVDETSGKTLRGADEMAVDDADWDAVPGVVDGILELDAKPSSTEQSPDVLLDQVTLCIQSRETEIAKHTLLRATARITLAFETLSPEERIRLCRRVGNLSPVVGEQIRGRNFTRMGLDAARSLTDPWERAQALADLLETYVPYGDVPGILQGLADFDTTYAEIPETVPEVERFALFLRRDELLLQVVKNQLWGAAPLESIWETIEAIVDPSTRDLAVIEVIDRFLNEQNSRDALAWTEEIADLERRRSVVERIQASAETPAVTAPE